MQADADAVGAAWREVPSTYVITEEDGAIPVFAQEAMAARTAHIERMTTSHSPFLSAPEALAEIIETAAAWTGPRASVNRHARRAAGRR